jgi:hypothetical protein
MRGSHGSVAEDSSGVSRCILSTFRSNIENESIKILSDIGIEISPSDRPSYLRKLETVMPATFVRFLIKQNTVRDFNLLAPELYI